MNKIFASFLASCTPSVRVRGWSHQTRLPVPDGRGRSGLTDEEYKYSPKTSIRVTVGEA